MCESSGCNNNAAPGGAFSALATTALSVIGPVGESSERIVRTPQRVTSSQKRHNSYNRPRSLTCEKTADTVGRHRGRYRRTASASAWILHNLGVGGHTNHQWGKRGWLTLRESSARVFRLRWAAVRATSRHGIPCGRIAGLAERPPLSVRQRSI
jgi:hypothetical protein